MLAELREQRNVNAQYDRARQTFEKFLSAVQVEKYYHWIDLKYKYRWTREKELSHNDENFILHVSAYSRSSSLSEANLEIIITADDGTQAKAELFRPGYYEGLLPAAMNEDVERISDIEEVVRNFNHGVPRIKTLSIGSQKISDPSE